MPLDKWGYEGGISGTRYGIIIKFGVFIRLSVKLL